MKKIIASMLLCGLTFSVMAKGNTEFEKELPSNTTILQATAQNISSNNLTKIFENENQTNIEKAGNELNISNISGLWYDAAMDGLGFNVIHASNGIFVYYYGYTKDGKRLWLVSDVGPVDLIKNQSYTLDLFEGTPNNGANFVTKPTVGNGVSKWGTLTMTIDSCTSGKMTLVGNDGEKIFNITKLGDIKATTCLVGSKNSLINNSTPSVENYFSPETSLQKAGSTSNISNISGLWYDAAMDGLGFNVIHASNGIFVYYYGYTKDGKRLWLVSDVGPVNLTKNQSYTLDLFEGTPNNGANFVTKPTVGNGVSKWGTLTMTIDSCTSGKMTLIGNDGQKIFNITKLGDIKSTTCEVSPEEGSGGNTTTIRNLNDCITFPKENIKFAILIKADGEVDTIQNVNMKAIDAQTWERTSTRDMGMGIIASTAEILKTSPTWVETISSIASVTGVFTATSTHQGKEPIDLRLNESRNFTIEGKSVVTYYNPPSTKIETSRDDYTMTFLSIEPLQTKAQYFPQTCKVKEVLDGFDIVMWYAPGYGNSPIKTIWDQWDEEELIEKSSPLK